MGSRVGRGLPRLIRSGRRRGLEDVGRDRDRATSAFSDRLCGRLDVGLCPGRADEVGPRLGESEGDAAADSLPGPGDDGDAAVQTESLEDHDALSASSCGAALPP